LFTATATVTFAVVRGLAPALPLSHISKVTPALVEALLAAVLTVMVNMVETGFLLFTLGKVSATLFFQVVCC
jgi:hypothetical protein